ncbi:hypothetical protein BGZ63DRAFT_378380 [Mariannaea sp. PMI_226]|nr:hypothetical protein BGZ63DRAFT_378380 [Mariannaea sp. PMI_226]
MGSVSFPQTHCAPLPDQDEPLIKVLTAVLPRGVFNIGDVIIITPTIKPQPNSDLFLIMLSVEILRREIGANGCWMLGSQDREPSDSQITSADGPKLHYLEDDSIRKLIELDTQSALTIVGVCAHTGEAIDEDTRKRALANASAYEAEITSLVANNLRNSVESLQGTETIVSPPTQHPEIPCLPNYSFPRHGEDVLLVIPTKNKFKTQLLKSLFECQAPKGVVVHLLTVPVDSNVGEQPYNDAGVRGAYNRISNALVQLGSEEEQSVLKDWGIGTVIVASIENFIQTDGVSRATDYGAIIIYNATTNQTRIRLSQGTTVPQAYVDRAKRFGFDENPDHGKVTVGQILAANVPGLDKADWHRVLAGKSRYDLLTEAAGAIEIPW